MKHVQENRDFSDSILKKRAIQANRRVQFLYEIPIR